MNLIRVIAEMSARGEEAEEVNPSALKRPTLGLNKAVSWTLMKLFFLLDSHLRSISHLIIATIETINEVDITHTTRRDNASFNRVLDSVAAFQWRNVLI